MELLGSSIFVMVVFKQVLYARSAERELMVMENLMTAITALAATGFFSFLFSFPKEFFQ